MNPLQARLVDGFNAWDPGQMGATLADMLHRLMERTHVYQLLGSAVARSLASATFGAGAISWTPPQKPTRLAIISLRVVQLLARLTPPAWPTLTT